LTDRKSTSTFTKRRSLKAGHNQALLGIAIIITRRLAFEETIKHNQEGEAEEILGTAARAIRDRGQFKTAEIEIDVVIGRDHAPDLPSHAIDASIEVAVGRQKSEVLRGIDTRQFLAVLAVLRSTRTVSRRDI